MGQDFFDIQYNDAVSSTETVLYQSEINGFFQMEPFK